MELLRASDRLATPWKNGGGETREVAQFPKGADWATFDWRISIATVAVSGPFSAFPGIDRTLAVLEGALRLTVDGVAQPVQFPSSEALRFDGGAETLGELIEGPVTDLNLMIRRCTCRGALMPLDRSAVQGIDDRRIILVTVPVDLGDLRLAPFDALVLAPGEELPLLPADARGWLVRLDDGASGG